MAAAFSGIRLIRTTIVLGVAVMLFAGWTLAAVAKPNPPGNNGTVKIDGVVFDTHPNNEPHVDCVFEVDFYGFDEGDLYATVTFEAHPPTGRGVLVAPPQIVFIGEDAAGGGTDLDAEQVYDLSGSLGAYEPHPIQGYHVKLTVNAEGSQGADTKHKVFWVTCAPPTTTTTTTTSSSTTSSTSSMPPGTPPPGG
jgi:hypothetical protein